MKIAIYSGEIPPPTFIEHLINGLAANSGVSVYVFGKRKGKVRFSKAVKVVATPTTQVGDMTITAYRTLLLLFRYYKRFVVLKAEVRKAKGAYQKRQVWSRCVPVLLNLPDVFHVQWAKDLSKWMFLKDAFHCKLVLSLLGSHINYSPIANPELAKSYLRDFPKVDAFHAVSEAIKLEAQKYGAPEAKIKVIPTILSPEVLKYKTIDLIKQPITLLSVGRHHWVKGYDYALTAMKHLRALGLQVHYTILAQGPVPEHLLFQSEQLGLEETVTFESGLSQTDLFRTMQNHDILLLPSLSEGIANVVLEAMALGIPVISTNCGGMAEVVKHKETGWLVPVRDPKAIAEAVVDIMQTSEPELQRITQHAHDFVKGHFNAEDSIAKFLGLYRKVMNDDR